jgi:SulP family sulfate permease
LFGVSVEKAEHHYETIIRVVEAAWENTHMLTLYIAILSLAVLWSLKHFVPKIPNVLVVVVVTTVLSWWVGFESKGGAVVGSIPEGLPGLSFPVIDYQVAVHMITAAVTIALIGFMEAISIAKTMASQSRDRLDPNQELVGQGLANITSSLFNGYPVSGSFSRSAVNFAAGAKTGFSSVVTAVVVGITLMFLTPLLYHLPQAALAQSS